MGDLSASAAAYIDVNDERVAFVEMELKMASKFGKALIWMIEIPIPIIILSIFISHLK